jgi:ribosomal-protein-alanine N-acetyltransferase
MCREGDLEGVLKIEKESFPDPYDRDVFSMLLQSEPEGFLVAECDDGVVGYVASSVRYGLIFSLAVSADHRRKKIGWILMDAVLGYLRGRTEKVSLQVRVGNFAAINLYRRFSFREEGRVRRYYPDGEDALVMSLEFRSP